MFRIILVSSHTLAQMALFFKPYFKNLLPGTFLASVFILFFFFFFRYNGYRGFLKTRNEVKELR